MISLYSSEKPIPYLVFTYFSGVRKAQAIAEKKSIFERYAEETAIALQELTGEKKDKIRNDILKLVEVRWGEIIEDDEKKLNNGRNSEKKEDNEEVKEPSAEESTEKEKEDSKKEENE